MVHTNVTIHFDEQGDYKQQQISKLNYEKNYWKSLAEKHHSELINIPEALNQYGYVDFYDDKGNLILTAIKKEQTPDE